MFFFLPFFPGFDGVKFYIALWAGIVKLRSMKLPAFCQVAFPLLVSPLFPAVLGVESNVS